MGPAIINPGGPAGLWGADPGEKGPCMLWFVMGPPSSGNCNTHSFVCKQVCQECWHVSQGDNMHMLTKGAWHMTAPVIATLEVWLLLHIHCTQQAWPRQTPATKDSMQTIGTVQSYL